MDMTETVLLSRELLSGVEDIPRDPFIVRILTSLVSPARQDSPNLEYYPILSPLPFLICLWMVWSAG